MSRLFFDHTPSSWQELEEMVHLAFFEMGYESQKQKQIKTVRGSVNIDVYAVKRSTPIPTLVLCECKYWNKKVPQSVVHSLRTVCSDAGAHFGIIISKRGFQPGAELSRGSTNVHLMKFDEFQETFFGEWKSGVNMLLSKMRDQILPLHRASMGYEKWGLDIVDRSELEGVNPLNKYSMIMGVDVSQFFIFDNPLPAILNNPLGDPKEMGQVTINSHREYLELAKKAVAECNDRFNIPEVFFSSSGKPLVPEYDPTE